MPSDALLMQGSRIDVMPAAEVHVSSLEPQGEMEHLTFPAPAYEGALSKTKREGAVADRLRCSALFQGPVQEQADSVPSLPCRGQGALAD
mmetsp:Transcript_3868/g.10962  ORF Transcript_3868/g.10962 Transcript_3868/m.10962 type:complete len:90 (+) Transcript_3868:1756-2025(+)